nr:MAG TPA: hypothetical protein [Caudoviricetes sp.]
MAQFKADGIDGLALTVQEIAEIPDEIKRQMLTAGGEVAAEAQRRKIRALGLVDSGQLVGSIVVKQKLYVDSRKNNAPAVLIAPTGTRKKTIVRHPQKKARARKRDTNNDVGFIQEFGAPRRNIPGKQWMAQANAECADAVTTAEFGVYDDWLKSKDL